MQADGAREARERAEREASARFEAAEAAEAQGGSVRLLVHRADNGAAVSVEIPRPMSAPLPSSPTGSVVVRSPSEVRPRTQSGLATPQTVSDLQEELERLTAIPRGQQVLVLGDGLPLANGAALADVPAFAERLRTHSLGVVETSDSAKVFLFNQKDCTEQKTRTVPAEGASAEADSPVILPDLSTSNAGVVDVAVSTDQSPIDRKLSSHGPRFKRDVTYAEELSKAAHARVDVCRDVATRGATMIEALSSAIASARSSLERREREFEEVCTWGLTVHKRGEDLLREFPRNLERLREHVVAPEIIQAASVDNDDAVKKKTLLDWVPVDALQNWKAECEQENARLYEYFHQQPPLRDIHTKLDECAAVCDKLRVDAVALARHFASCEDARSQISDGNKQFEVDLRTVLSKLEDITPASGLSVRTALLDNLGEMARDHDQKLDLMKQFDASLREKVSAAAQLQSTISQAQHGQLQQVWELSAILRQEHQRLILMHQTAVRLEDGLFSFEYVAGMPDAYDAMTAEIHHRRLWATAFRELLRNVNDALRSTVQGERILRKHYAKEFGRYLPRELCPPLWPSDVPAVELDVPQYLTALSRDFALPAVASPQPLTALRYPAEMMSENMTLLRTVRNPEGEVILRTLLGAVSAPLQQQAASHADNASGSRVSQLEAEIVQLSTQLRDAQQRQVQKELELSSLSVRDSRAVDAELSRLRTGTTEYKSRIAVLERKIEQTLRSFEEASGETAVLQEKLLAAKDFASTKVREAERAAADLKRADRRIAELDTELSSSILAASQLSESRESTRVAAQVEIDQLREEQERLSAEASRLKSEAKQASATQASLQEEREKLETSVSQYQTQLDQQKSLQQELEDEVASLRLGLDQMRKEHEASRAEHEQAELKSSKIVTETETKFASMMSRLDRMIKREAEHLESLQRLVPAAPPSQMSETVRAVEQEVSRLKQHVDGAGTAARRAEEQLAEARRELAASRAEVQSLRDVQQQRQLSNSEGTNNGVVKVENFESDDLILFFPREDVPGATTAKPLFVAFSTAPPGSVLYYLDPSLYELQSIRQHIEARLPIVCKVVFVEEHGIGGDNPLDLPMPYARYATVLCEPASDNSR